MKYMVIWLCLLFVNITVNATEIDTLSILTNNSQRYWNVLDNNNIGVCFCNNGDFEDFIYKKRHISCSEEQVFRYETSSYNTMSLLGTKFRLKDGEIEIYYKRTPHIVLKKYVIINLSNDKICLLNENDTLTYCLASDQDTPITVEPELQRGYRLAKIQDPNAISCIIDSVQHICRIERMDMPLSFKVDILLGIDVDGSICNANYVTGTTDYFPGKGSERFFYSLLLDGIKQLRFSPAKNDRTSETFFCEFLMPIKYSSAKQTR